MAPRNVHVCPSNESLTSALAYYIDSALKEFEAAASPKFTVAFSGGSFPKLLAQALSKLSASRDLHSAQWHVFYVDERVVALDHADSNHAAMQSAVYSQSWWHGSTDHIHTIAADLSTASAVADDYETQVGKLFQCSTARDAQPPVFDLILLGMGPDGHTASLFPGHPLLTEQSRLVTFIEDSPKPPPRRITFSYKLINAATRVAFVATGDSKADVLAQIFDPAIPLEQSLPSARVRQRGTELPTWFVDAGAASKIL